MKVQFLLAVASAPNILGGSDSGENCSPYYRNGQRDPVIQKQFYGCKTLKIRLYLLALGVERKQNGVVAKQVYPQHN